MRKILALVFLTLLTVSAVAQKPQTPPAGVVVAAAPVTTYSGVVTQTVLTYTPASDSFLLICSWVETTVANSAGSSAIQYAGYSYGAHQNGATTIGTTASTATQWNFAAACVPYYASGGHAVTVTLLFTGTTGNPTTAYAATISKLE